MKDAHKEKLKPLYSEFQGYLSQAPLAKSSNDYFSDEHLWNQYNETVKLLMDMAGEGYARFIIHPIEGGLGDTFIYVNTYRQKLGGLISNLHAKYFSDEPAPFIGRPSTVITQTQQQSQSFQVQILLDVQSKIDENLPKYEEGTKEKKFLDTFKSKLSTISSVNELFSECLKLAKKFGINIATLLDLFS